MKTEPNASTQQIGFSGDSPALRSSSEPVGIFDQPIGQIVGHFEGLVLLETMFSDQAAEKCAIDATRHIVPRRNREERPRVVVESDRVVEPCRFGGQLAKTHHALRTVMKPPRRSEAQAG